jgi:hypothetical protein
LCSERLLPTPNPVNGVNELGYGPGACDEENGITGPVVGIDGAGAAITAALMP